MDGEPLDFLVGICRLQAGSLLLGVLGKCVQSVYDTNL